MSELQEVYVTDLSSWRIGPYHRALPGPMRLELLLDGEIVVSGSVETGYLHRGVEKAFELRSWLTCMPYADRLDPEGAIFAEIAFALAVEEIAGMHVPARAEQIRIILAELARIASHLAYIARVGRGVVGDTIVHYVLRDRERILDLFELLTGARFTLNFLRFGGVAADVTEGFIERVLEVCDLIRIRLKEYNDLFSFNQAFLRRTEGVGLLSANQVQAHGLTGPNARAAGLVFDTRKSHPYSGYELLDFEVPLGAADRGASDSHSRFLLRLREISVSVDILRQVAESVAPGPFASEKIARDYAVPAGEAYVRVESSRGMLGCHVVSDGTPKPARVQFRTPSLPSIQAIPLIVPGTRLEDLPVLLASLDLSIPEVDK